jgi:hypothetical protein
MMVAGEQNAHDDHQRAQKNTDVFLDVASAHHHFGPVCTVVSIRHTGTKTLSLLWTAKPGVDHHHHHTARWNYSIDSWKIRFMEDSLTPHNKNAPGIEAIMDGPQSTPLVQQQFLES